MVNLGGRLYTIPPTAPDPSAFAVELSVKSDTELDIVGDKGYGGYGEVMRYTFRGDGSVAEVWAGGGQRLVPFAEFTLPDIVRRPA